MLAWAAGIIDGEGSVMILRTKPNHRCTRGQVVPRVMIEMCSAEVVNKFAELFGGKVHFIANEYKSRTNRRPSYRWLMDCGKAVEVLELIRPWLIAKAAHASLVIRFWRECRIPRGSNSKLGFSGFRKMTDAEFDRRLEYYEEMKGLQIKGPEALN